MKAIVYLRVSSEEQVSGNGLERQLDTVISYCQQNHLDIVHRVSDEGKSASKGHHINGGELGKLLSSIRAGTYRNHALVVEYLDRLSRQGFEQTFAILYRRNRVTLSLETPGIFRFGLAPAGTGLRPVGCP
jgi:DNA invertase Pin-like site-specific DNA recombinase